MIGSDSFFDQSRFCSCFCRSWQTVTARLEGLWLFWTTLLLVDSAWKENLSLVVDNLWFQGSDRKSVLLFIF